MKLNRKILLVTIATLFVSLLISSVVNIVSFRKNYTDALILGTVGLGQTLNSIVREMLELGLPLESLAGMDKKLQTMRADNPHIGYVAIGKLDGKALYHSNPELVGKVFSDEVMRNSIATLQPLTQIYNRFDGLTYYDVTLPIFDSSGEHIGLTRLGFLSSEVEDKVWEAIRHVAINFVLSFVGISLLLHYLLTRLISQRIEVLSEQAQEIAGGNFDRLATFTDKDEIGQLSVSLKEMATTIRSQIDELREARDTLEHQVIERTAALESSNFNLLRTQEDLLTAQRIAKVGSWSLDLASNRVHWSEELYLMQGLVPGTAPPDYTESAKLFTPDSWEKLSTAIARAAGQGIPYELELEMVKPDGSHGWMQARGEPVRDKEGAIVGVHGVAVDITQRKQYELRIEHVAHYDALTGMPNRTLLADRLHQGMMQTHRRARSLVVVYLDLDGFKAINDSYGHDVGDRLLQIVAIRMKQVLREGDTLARIGGDEFVAVLLDIEDIAASEPMLDRLLDAASQPVEVESLTLQVSASLGVTLYPQKESVDADQLLRQADQAMYQAKLAGKNQYYVFDTDLDNSIRGHHEILEAIRLALVRHEFVLHYQPKVNMLSGEVVGAEALIRWQHPEKGLLPPAYFLPLIEEHVLAIEIGEWVLETALSQIESWQKTGLSIPLSVNVSALHLQKPGFTEKLQSALAAHPAVQRSALEIEVLETSALEDIVHVSEVMNECRKLGVSFALDDFGTGYSSLTYLKRLPVSVLKIDQSFVRDMLEDPDDLAILEGVISLARAFGHEVIAEGVETIEAGEMLLQLGCKLAQGYGIARPMPAEDLPAWVAAWHPSDIWARCRTLEPGGFGTLLASVEHRAWTIRIESFLKGESDSMPQTDEQACGFGAWLESKGNAHYRGHPSFPVIEEVHSRIHALATSLIELHAKGDVAEALRQLPALHALRDELLGNLKALIVKAS